MLRQIGAIRQNGGMHECSRCGTLHPAHDDHEPAPPSQGELLEACDQLRQERIELDELERDVVTGLRELRVPWALIAARLGVPDSTLRRTYAGV
jgi:hypothetical protein